MTTTKSTTPSTMTLMMMCKWARRGNDSKICPAFDPLMSARKHAANTQHANTQARTHIDTNASM